MHVDPPTEFEDRSAASIARAPDSIVNWRKIERASKAGCKHLDAKLYVDCPGIGGRESIPKAVNGSRQ